MFDEMLSEENQSKLVMQTDKILQRNSRSSRGYTLQFDMFVNLLRAIMKLEIFDWSKYRDAFFLVVCQQFY